MSVKFFINIVLLLIFAGCSSSNNSPLIVEKIVERPVEVIREVQQAKPAATFPPAPTAAPKPTEAPKPAAAPKPISPEATTANASVSGGATPQQRTAQQNDTKGSSGLYSVVEPQIARMVIRNASMSLEVKNVATSLDSIGMMVVNLGGYVHSASVMQNTDGSAKADITLKVPSDKLEITLSQLRGAAVIVRDERISAQDVTAEFADLGARVKNLEAAEVQMREILAKTTDTKDLVVIFKQLTDLRGEIEQAKGRMNYLAQSSALSTIILGLYHPALPITPTITSTPTATPTTTPTHTATAIPTATPWNPGKQIDAASVALTNVTHTTGNALIWLVVWALPQLLAIGLIGWLVWLVYRRFIRRTPPTPPTPPVS